MRIAGSRRVLSWIAALVSLSGLIPAADAQEHLVPLSEVRHDLESAAAQRASNISDIERLLARPEAQQELAKAKLNSSQVEKAISLMNDDELARLASRARSADQDVHGGFIKTILAIIGAIVVIIVVVAVVA